MHCIYKPYIWGTSWLCGLTWISLFLSYLKLKIKLWVQVKTFSSLRIATIIIHLVLIVLLLETLTCYSFIFKGTAIIKVNCWAASVSAVLSVENSQCIFWYCWLILVVKLCQHFKHLTVLYSTKSLAIN